MRIPAVIIFFSIAFLMSGCGLLYTKGAGSNGAGAASFASIAGTYQATCTGTSGIYTSQVSVGQTFTFHIDSAGVVTATDFSGSPITYHLTRQGDGSLLTNHRALGSGDYEVGYGPGSLSSFNLNAYDSTNTVLGTEANSVVKLSSG